jgi:hypothetical protein
MVRRCFRNVGIWLGDEDARERFVRGNESTRVGAPRAGYLAGESFGTHCLCSHRWARGSGTAELVRGSCCAAFHRQAMPGGESRGATASLVKPSSGEAQRVSKRRASGHRISSRGEGSTAPPRRSCTVEASWFVGSRFSYGGAVKAGLAEANGGRSTGRRLNAEVTGRQRFGRKRFRGSRRPERTRPVRRSGACRRKRYASPASKGPRSCSELVVARDAVGHR